MQDVGFSVLGHQGRRGWREMVDDILTNRWTFLNVGYFDLRPWDDTAYKVLLTELKEAILSLAQSVFISVYLLF